MSINPKPYYDDIKTRSALLKTIEICQDKGSLDAEMERNCGLMYSFYRSPAPLGYEYVLDEEWVMGEEFSELYAKLQKLLFETINSAKSEKTKTKRRLEALSLALGIWKKGYGFDEEADKIITRRIAK